MNNSLYMIKYIKLKDIYILVVFFSFNKFYSIFFDYNDYCLKIIRLIYILLI